MKIKVDNLEAEIVKITNQYNVRIIVVGHRGSGKSSLINTFQSAMKNTRVKTAVSRTEAETISQNVGTIRKYLKSFNANMETKNET